MCSFFYKQVVYNEVSWLYRLRMSFDRRRLRLIDKDDGAAHAGIGPRAVLLKRRYESGTSDI